MYIYYVYQYLREDLTPYYIGKGKGRRAYIDHGRIKLPKDKQLIQIIAHKLTESESMLLERKLIAYHGRKDIGTGILRNMTDGGDGTSGRAMLDSTKQKLPGVHLGAKRSEETKRKISIQAKQRTHESRLHSVETKAKISAGQLGNKRSESTKEKLRVPKSDQAKQNMSIAARNRQPISIEARIEITARRARNLIEKNKLF